MAWTLPDLIVFGCQVVMLLALYPTLKRRSRWPDVWTCLLTAWALTAMGLVFLYLNLAASSIITGLIAVAWWYMCFQSVDDEAAREQTLFWELTQFLKAQESWEAHLVLENSWNGKDGMPTLTDADYKGLMDLQARRNALLERIEKG
jgi:hypothetical protein